MLMISSPEQADIRQIVKPYFYSKNEKSFCQKKIYRFWPRRTRYSEPYRIFRVAFLILSYKSPWCCRKLPMYTTIQYLFRILLREWPFPSGSGHQIFQDPDPVQFPDSRQKSITDKRKYDWCRQEIKKETFSYVILLLHEIDGHFCCVWIREKKHGSDLVNISRIRNSAVLALLHVGAWYIEISRYSLPLLQRAFLKRNF